MDAADIVIIGAGAGAKLIWGSVPGRSVAVVEQELVGGYCPFYACVPSKAMLRSARVWGLGADEQFSGLFTGRSDATAAYRQAVARRERIVNSRDDSLTAAALQKTGARLLRGTGARGAARGGGGRRHPGRVSRSRPEHRLDTARSRGAGSGRRADVDQRAGDEHQRAA